MERTTGDTIPYRLFVPREYLTGLSIGGECARMSIIEQPDRFAAAVPICAGDRFIAMTASERGKTFSRKLV